jgi:hypothetical protein
VGPEPQKFARGLPICFHGGPANQRATTMKSDGSKRSFLQERDYRTAQELFEAALSACKRLSPEDRQSLLSKVEKQSSRYQAVQPTERETVRIMGITISESP